MNELQLERLEIERLLFLRDWAMELLSYRFSWVSEREIQVKLIRIRHAVHAHFLDEVMRLVEAHRAEPSHKM